MKRFGSGKDVGPHARDVAAEPDSRGFEGAAIRAVQTFLDIGIDGKRPFASAHAVADAALRKHGESEGAVDAVIRAHLGRGMGSGFLTSAGGFLTVPVAMPANIVSFYVIATRMTAGVARLRGYDIDDPATRSAVLLTLVGADADDILAKAGMLPKGGPLANLAAQQLPGPALMFLNKAVAFRLFARVGSQSLSRFGRAVPVVGGAVGGAFDGWLLGRIAQSARGEFPRLDVQITSG